MGNEIENEQPQNLGIITKKADIKYNHKDLKSLKEHKNVWKKFFYIIYNEKICKIKWFIWKKRRPKWNIGMHYQKDIFRVELLPMAK